MVVSGLQKQGAIFIIAAMVAFYQVYKWNVLFQQQDAVAEDQLRKALYRLQSACHQRCMLFKAEEWRDQMREQWKKGAGESRETFFIMGKPDKDHSLPYLKGEIFIDPLQQKKVFSKNKQRQKPYHNQQQKKKKQTQQLPLLGIRVYDSSIQVLAEDLRRAGLVERIILKESFRDQGSDFQSSHQVRKPESNVPDTKQPETRQEIEVEEVKLEEEKVEEEEKVKENVEECTEVQ